MTGRCSWRGLALGALLIVSLAASPAYANFGYIEAPAANATVSQPFIVSGWVIDLVGSWGTGIDLVQIKVCAGTCPGANWINLGYATYGLPRPDIAEAYGNPGMTNSGFSMVVDDLAPGTYILKVRSHSSLVNTWSAWTETIHVQPGPSLVVESPAASAAVAQPFSVSGWTLDSRATTGIGIDWVGVFGYPNVGSGAPSQVWGAPSISQMRPDVAAAFGSQFTMVGWTQAVSGQAPGQTLLETIAHSPVDNSYVFEWRTVYVDMATAGLTIDRQGSGTGSVSAAGLTCPGGAGTQGLPCGAAYVAQTPVTLTAVADTGATFSGWGGACHGLDPCLVTMDQAQYVVAVFTKTAVTYAMTYYHTDMVGSIRAITDATGAVVTRHDYLPFGEDSAPLTGDPLRFGGKQLDSETANEYFEARYLRTNWGRFLTPDPVDGNPADPQSWNRYAYARNNPLRVVDPTGESYTFCLQGGRDDKDFCGYYESDSQFFADLYGSGAYAENGKIFAGAEYAGWYIYECGIDCQAALGGGIRLSSADDSGGGGGGGGGTGGAGGGTSTPVTPTGTAATAQTSTAPVSPAAASVGLAALAVVAAPAELPAGAFAAGAAAFAGTVYLAHEAWEQRSQIADAVLHAASWVASILNPFPEPAEPPADDFVWKGHPVKGSWVNEKTGEAIRDDPDHPLPIGPHVDYRAPDGTDYRVFRDGRVLPK